MNTFISVILILEEEKSKVGVRKKLSRWFKRQRIDPKHTLSVVLCKKALPGI